MKNLVLLALLATLFSAGCKQAAPRTGLTLSTAQPAAGETITMTYNPTGTPLQGKGTPDCIAYLVDDKKNPAVDVDLKPDGKAFTGSFVVPGGTKLVFIRLFKDKETDNNQQKGYAYLVYKDGKPVPGAYAMKEMLYANGYIGYIGKIKTDVPEAIAAFKKEFELHPETKKDYEVRYAYLLTRYKAPEAKALLQKATDELLASGDEKLMLGAVQVMDMQNRKPQADSLKTLLRAKFPKEMARNDMDDAFNNEQDPAKMELIYNKYIQNPANAPLTAGEKDSYITSMIYADIEKGRFDDCYRLIKMVNDETQLPGVLNDAGWGKAQKGADLDKLAALSKMSIDILRRHMNNPKLEAFQTKKTAAKDMQAALEMYSDTYAYILGRMGRYDEAYRYDQPVYASTKGDNANFNETYTDILKGLNKNKEAQDAIAAAMKKGKATDKMKASLKALYVKEKGTDSGYDEYLAPIRTAYLKTLRTNLMKEMTNDPAPAFALKDFDGKTVSLASLKGKVVVVDFWATWCGPCKASFPGMQKALNKYKDNAGVQFVFIDTWENGDNYLPAARKFIADNKYTFHVLEDEKVDERQGKIVTDYGVDGIPTKFVIDAKGNIRFKKVGGGGGNDNELVDEVSAMIDLATGAGSAGNRLALLK